MKQRKNLEKNPLLGLRKREKQTGGQLPLKGEVAKLSPSWPWQGAWTPVQEQKRVLAEPLVTGLRALQPPSPG